MTLYCLGRLPIELVRIDPANEILGLRVNVWVAVLIGTGGLVYFVLSRRRFPRREEPQELRGKTEAEVLDSEEA